MRKYLLIAAALLGIGLGPAKAADSTVSALTSASAFAGTELLYIVQSAADRKGTPAQMATYVYGLMSGDCTVAASVITCAKINGNTFPASGTSGGIPYFSGANAISSSAALTANLPVIGGGAGVAPSVGTRSGNTTGFATFTGTVTGATNCAQWDTNGNLTAAAASCGSGGSGITSLTPGAGLVSGVTTSCAQAAITTTGTLSAAECLNAQTGTTYAIVDGDRGKLITGSNAAAQAYSIAQAGAASAFANGWYTTISNKGVGTLTITPTTSTINGAASYALFAGQSVRIISDGTNYQIDPGTTGGVVVSDQTGANYAFVASDYGKLIYLSNGSNQIPTLPNANTLGANWFLQVCNIGAGTQTITPTTSTIGGAATFVLPAGSAASPNCAAIIGDGTNYRVYPDFFRTGANVATAAALALSAAGGLSTTVASGTSALGTGAITSATCASVVTTSATNTATTDVVWWGFNGDPTAVTGYVPATTGMLTIIAYPSANNVNFKVCNNTSASITPGAITLNWRVLR